MDQFNGGGSVQSGLDTLLKVDGNGGGDQFQTLATLKNTQADHVKLDQVILKMSELDAASGEAAAQPAAVPPPVQTTTASAIPQATPPAPPLVQTFTGGAGNDFFMGQAGAQTYIGGLGLDRVDYSASSSGLVVDMANPSASTGHAAGDVFVSIENIVGSRFDDTIRGSQSDDWLYGGAGQDVIFGGDGNDNLRGDAGDDTLDGGAGDDELRGGDGDDLLIGGMGADAFVGGGGTDTVSYAGARAGVSASLANDIASWLPMDEAAGDRFSSIENLLGSSFDDYFAGDVRANTINGGLGNDTLKGGGGIDTLHGGGGDDMIFGGDGRDMLIGGAGRDSFVFGGPSTFGDRIADFESGIDRLLFDAAALNLSPAAVFDFVASAAPRAVSSGPSFLFNAATGTLFFDADGVGAGRAVAVAFLDPNAPLSASDLFLI